MVPTFPNKYTVTTFVKRPLSSASYITFKSIVCPGGTGRLSYFTFVHPQEVTTF